MKIKLLTRCLTMIIASAVVWQSSNAAGRTPPPSTIVHGQPATVEGYNFTPAGAIYYRYNKYAEGADHNPDNLEATGYALMCTGTLIAPDVVLTAAHCDPKKSEDAFGEQYDITEYWFSFDNDITQEDTNNTAPSFALSMDMSTEADTDPTNDHFLAHEDYNSSWDHGYDLSNDIGLMFLNGSVYDIYPDPQSDGVMPAYLGADGGSGNDLLTVGENVTLVGYGMAYPYKSDNGAGLKRYGVAPVVDITENMLFVSDYSPKDVTACLGDSGGPAFEEEQETQGVPLHVLGITSGSATPYLLKCNRGVYTRVQHYISWINDRMVDACALGTRTAEMCNTYPVAQVDNILGN